MMVSVMKFVAVLLSGFLGLALAAGNAPLSQVRAVYLFPMGNGLDQYLANRITNSGLFRVVTDPKKADAVFTDRLGDNFTSQLDEIYPETAPAPRPQKAKKPAAGTASPGGEQSAGAAVASKPEETGTTETTETTETPAAAKQARAVPLSSFGRGKGTIFLVDARTRTVLWSTYQKPRSSASEELDRTAEQIVTRLKRDLKNK